MKYLALTCMLLCTVPAVLVFAQEPQASRPPQQVALIDMAHVFKNYEKFTAMTEALQKEIEQTDLEAKSKVEHVAQLQQQLQSSELKVDSPDYARIENELLTAQTELESFKRTSQRDFLRREAEIYKTVYLEVQDAVKRYADYFKYPLVLRFNRQKVEEAENPRDVINGMNRQVVYFQPQNDITDPILKHLNETWRAQQKQPSPSRQPATQSAGRPGQTPATR